MADEWLKIPGPTGANAGATVSSIVAGMAAGADDKIQASRLCSRRVGMSRPIHVPRSAVTSGFCRNHRSDLAEITSLLSVIKDSLDRAFETIGFGR